MRARGHRLWQGATSAARLERCLRALPRVDQVDVRVPKVLQVARGQSCAMGAADGGDLRIEPVDRQSDLVTAPDDICIVRGRTGVEGEHLILEGGEHLCCGGAQEFLAAPIGQPGDAVEDLGERDRR